MYLKSLELTGFKSFADKTVVEFNRGITSIVGPNGSGKSNILDAILWVLGEQSYKNIRAKESSDIIFSGGKNKKSRSMAEVSLIIDNEDKFIDIDFSEIKITRRIYKNGENEYLINNRKTRLKDINNLFMDTGIGKQAYSIIGQGKVEKIVSANPRELKEIIEEAAGVKRAKIEKEDSLKKLKEIKDEVEKIEYVENELFQRVSNLKEESLKARLYKSFTEKIDTQKYMILEYEINKKREKQNEYNLQNEKLNEKILYVKNELFEKNKSLKMTSDEKSEKYTLLENEKKKNVKNFSEIEKLKNDFIEIKNNISKLEIEKNEKNKRKININVELNEKKLVLQKSKLEYDNINNDFLNKENEKNILNSKVNDLKIKRENIIEELSKLKDENQNFEVEKIKIKYENQDLEKRIIGAKRENKRLQDEKKVIENEHEKTRKSLEEIEKLEKDYKNKEKKQKIEIKNLKENIHFLKKDFEKLNKEKNNLQYKLERIISKRRAIENIIENNENFNRSAKYLLNEKIDGIIGGYINLIDIPLGYENVFQTLIGSFFQDIVVEKSSVAQKCISILKEKKLGRASFLPIDTLKVFKLMDIFPDEDGVIGFARNLIKYDKKIQKIVEFTLGNTLVVKDLEAGRKIAKNGFSNKIVTLDGDVISSGGRMTGGYIAKGKDEILEKKREQSLLILEEKKEKNILIELEEKIEKIFIKIEKEEKILESIEEIYVDFNEEYKKVLEKVESYNDKYSRNENQLKTLNYEINENENFVKNRENNVNLNIQKNDDINKKIIENKNKINDLNKEIEKISNLSEYTEKLNKVNTEFEILKVKMENNRNRFFEIDGDYNKLKNELESIVNFENESELLIKKFVEKKEDKKREIEIKENENNSTNNFIVSLEDEIKKLEVAEKEYITDCKNIELNLVNYLNENEKIEEILLKNKKELEDCIKGIEEINENKIKDNSIYKKIEDEVEQQSVRRKMNMNEKERIEIGNVNLLAIEEYEKENAKYNNIVDQKRDLIKSRELLLLLIKDIEKQIIAKFSEAFNEINKNFDNMCKRILNGAKGSLRLTNEEDLLETGMELSVKYKNKPEQTLLLLSGGEKAMLAVSFIMAIFMYKPSPFTFFDEIEAALDDTNTKKIIELLNEFIKKSQFILITHNKETMKGSHRLYGVTMNKEVGESKLISVDI